MQPWCSLPIRKTGTSHYEASFHLIQSNTIIHPKFEEKNSNKQIYHNQYLLHRQSNAIMTEITFFSMFIRFNQSCSFLCLLIDMQNARVIYNHFPTFIALEFRKHNFSYYICSIQKKLQTQYFITAEISKNNRPAFWLFQI